MLSSRSYGDIVVRNPGIDEVFVSGTSTRLLDQMAKGGQRTWNAQRPLHSAHTSYSLVTICRSSRTAFSRSSTETATQDPKCQLKPFAVACLRVLERVALTEHVPPQESPGDCIGYADLACNEVT